MNIPQKLSQQAVTKFSYAIDVIGCNYPNTVLIDPSPVGAEGFKDSLRKAIRGLATYGHVHKSVGKEQAIEWLEDLSLRVVQGKVAIGTKKGIYDYLPTTKQHEQLGLALDAEVKPIDTASLTPEDLTLLDAMLLLQDAGYVADLKFNRELKEIINESIERQALDLESHESDTHIHIF